MNMTLDLSSVLGAATLTGISIIGFFLRRMFHDFESNKQSNEEMKQKFVELSFNMKALEKDMSRMNENLSRLSDIKEDIAILKRDQKSLWEKIELKSVQQ